MKIVDCEQGTPEWFKARLGKPSASCFGRLLTTKGEPSTQRLKYMYQLAGERITGLAEETYQSAAMLRGLEVESEARAFYEFTSGQSVAPAGFCMSNCERYGASPDGFVGAEGIIEIKCPSSAIHVGYLLENKLPTDYFQQVQGQLFVTGYKWADFVSYYPGIKPLVIRVTPDREFHKALKEALEEFCLELEHTVKRIS